VIATEPLEVVTIWRNDFCRFFRKLLDRRKSGGVVEAAAQTHRTGSSRLATMDVYGRLARFFLDLAREWKPSTTDTLRSRASISPSRTMIGTSRETVSRLIHDLMRQNLLSRKERHLLTKRARSIPRRAVILISRTGSTLLRGAADSVFLSQSFRGMS